MRRVMRVLLFTGALLAGLGAVSAGAVATHFFYEVSFVNSSVGYLAGAYSPRTGLIAKTTDGGKTWSPVRVSNASLRGLAPSTDGSRAWSVGTYDDALYAASGTPLSVSRRSPIMGTSSSNFRDVALLAGGRRVIVGQRVGVEGGDIALIASGLTDDGPWAIDYQGPFYPPPTSDTASPTTIAEMSAIDAAPGGLAAFAVGNEWSPSSGGGGSGASYKRPLVFKTADGGVSWQLTPTMPAPGGPVTSLSVVSDSVAYAGVGASGRSILRTTDGTAWVRVVIPRDDTPGNLGVRDVSINGIDAFDADRLVVVGENGKIAWTSNASAAVPTWSYKTLSSKVSLRGVAMVDAKRWVVVGDSETIMRTTDGGATWTGISGAQAPSLTVGSSPSSGFTLNSSPLVFSGSASDAGVGVMTVELKITRSDGWSWNGIAWTPTSSWVKASTSDGWAHWRYSWTPDITVTTGREAVKVSIRAVDGAGLSDTTNRYSKKVRPIVGTPASISGARKNVAFTVSGSLQPRHKAGTKAVTLYFDKRVGSKWVRKSTVSAVMADAATGSRYNASVVLGAGSWRVRANHSDAGHLSTYSGYRTFSVK
jgi:photosystem II stability/assembly factor-like uncharacterized protein